MMISCNYFCKYIITKHFFLLLLFLDWESEAVAKAEILRLIYQGRFLHCNVTLGALGLPLGKTTVMHLVPRDNLPEPNSQGKSKIFIIIFINFIQTCLKKIKIIKKKKLINKNKKFQIRDKRVKVDPVDVVPVVVAYCN